MCTNGTVTFSVFVKSVSVGSLTGSVEWCRAVMNSGWPREHWARGINVLCVCRRANWEPIRSQWGEEEHRVCLCWLIILIKIRVTPGEGMFVGHFLIIDGCERAGTWLPYSNTFSPAFCFVVSSTVYAWLSWNLLCRSDRPQMQRSSCLCLLRVLGIAACPTKVYFNFFSQFLYTV